MRAIFFNPLTVLFLLATSTAALPVLATPSDGDMEKAKESYRAGREHFAAGRMAEALAAFTEAYNLSGEPNLLYNLGVCAEETGDRDKAIAYLELYLEEVPDAADAAEIRARVDRLKADREAAAAPAPDKAPAASAPVAPSAPLQAPPVAGAPPPDKAPEAAPLSREQVAAYYGEDRAGEGGVFWPGVALGGGGLVLLGGTITAILAYKERDSLEAACAPDCTASEVETGKNLALASDIQFGIGAAVVVTGAALWIADHLKHRKDAPAGKSEAAWNAAPFARPDGAGLAVGGRF